MWNVFFWKHTLFLLLFFNNLSNNSKTRHQIGHLIWAIKSTLKNIKENI